MEGPSQKQPPAIRGLGAMVGRQARRRSEELRQAREIASALGLPPEEQYAIRAALYETDSEAIPVVEVDDVDARIRLFHLVDKFLRTHLADQVERFRTLWDAVGSVPFAFPPTTNLGWQFAPLSADDLSRYNGTAEGPLGREGESVDASAVVRELIDLLATIEADPRLSEDHRATIGTFVQAGRQWLEGQEA